LQRFFNIIPAPPCENSNCSGKNYYHDETAIHNLVISRV